MTRFASATAVLALSSASFATVTPGTLFGDSYIVKEGAGASAKFYSVLDVYIKSSTSKDVISSIFGVTAYTSAFTMNQGDAFVQTNGGTNSAWLPSAGQTGWDSFVTNGNRDQASAASTLNMLLDTNWGSGNGSSINNATGTGGAGWYPGVGASTSTNPYARTGFYNGDTTAINTAKATTNIAGNGITVGQNLNNHWMIGRFVIDVTQTDVNTPIEGPKTMTLKFAVAGRNFATESSTSFTTFTGSTSAAGRFNYTLSFAVPAPGAAALVGLAGLLIRRRGR